MGLRDRFGIRRLRGSFAATLDREATPTDVEQLVAFVQTRRGVEFFVEPETAATDTTTVAVASDGEWIRRRVGSPAVIGRVARRLGVPIYNAEVIGYPARMRAWSAAHPERHA
jgi:hypothetical protein